MKNITTILGILAIILLTSATTVNIMTIKPATPVGSLTAYFKSDFSSLGGTKASKWIKQMTMDGWIVKHHSMSENTVLVTMEKY